MGDKEAKNEDVEGVVGWLEEDGEESVDSHDDEVEVVGGKTVDVAVDCGWSGMVIEEEEVAFS